MGRNKKIVVEIPPCAHCGELFPFKIFFCPMCKIHCHEYFLDKTKNTGLCIFCRDDLKRAAQKAAKESADSILPDFGEIRLGEELI